MQKSLHFGAETSFLRHFQLIFRPCTHVRSLLALRRSLLLGASYDFPKNYDFSERYIAIYINKKGLKVRQALSSTKILERYFFERKAEDNKIISEMHVLVAFFGILIVLLKCYNLSILELYFAIKSSKPTFHFPEWAFFFLTLSKFRRVVTKTSLPELPPSLCLLLNQQLIIFLSCQNDSM